MAVVVGIILALIAVVLIVKIVSPLVGLALMLVMAGLIGYLADRIVPGKLPYGIVGMVGAGLLGSILGSWILGGFGPTLFNITLIPALLGAIGLAFGAKVVGKATGADRIGPGSRSRELGRRW